MAVITNEDVAAAIGRPISDSDEQVQIEQWISDVELIIRARIPDLTVLDQDLLAYVEREAVIARMRYRADRNSARSTSSEDDTDTGNEHYFLRILNPWWVLLDPEKSETATGSIRPSFEPDNAQYAVASSKWESDMWWRGRF